MRSTVRTFVGGGLVVICCRTGCKAGNDTHVPGNGDSRRIGVETTEPRKSASQNGRLPEHGSGKWYRIKALEGSAWKLSSWNINAC